MTNGSSAGPWFLFTEVLAEERSRVLNLHAVADHQGGPHQGGVTRSCAQSEAGPRRSIRVRAGLKTRSISMTVEAIVDDRYVLATGTAGAARLALLDQVYGPDA